MDATYIVYGALAVFAIFIIAVGVVVWRNRGERSTGPGPTEPLDVGRFRQDGL